MKFYKYGILAVAMSAVIAVSVVGCSGSKVDVAATVNGKDIKIAEVDNRLAQMTGQPVSALTGQQGDQLKAQYRDKVLDQMIDMEVLLSEADKRGLQATSKDIDKKVKEILKTYNFKDQKALEDALKQQNLTFAQFKEQLTQSIRVEKLGDSLTKSLKVSDKEITTYYNKNKTKFAVKDQIHVAHILVQKEDQAAKVLKEIQAGGDFAKLAKQYSIDPGSKDNGGDLPLTDKEKFVAEFSKAAWALKPGQISGLVKTSYGYHIIKMIEKKDAYQKTLDQAKKEIKNTLLAQKKQEIFAKWLADAKKKASIKKYLTTPSTTAAPAADAQQGAPGAPGASSGTGSTGTQSTQAAPTQPSQSAPASGQ
ncbi:MAG TPA: peptidylprolyl isomerase [Candidatus Aquicultor sp.]|jgi:foldase protein PrsA